MPVRRICNTCKKEFYTPPSSPGKYCSPECFHKTGKKGRKRIRVQRACQFCGKQFEIIPSWLKGGGGKYCSRECQHNQKKTITGINHPLHKPKVEKTCKFCGKVYYVKPSEVERSKFCSRKCGGAWRVMNIQSPTSIEIKIANILSDIGARYYSQVQIGQWLCDFVVGKLVIEADGKYWHSLPKRIYLDKQKDKFLKEQGYRVLRLGEDDINLRAEWCKRQIISHLN